MKLANRAKLAALCWTLAAMAWPVAAADFRIESKVYVGDESKPVSETLTLFQTGVVYDFLAQPAQITVFKKALGSGQGRFILLDPARQEKTELTTDQMLRFSTQLKAWAAGQEDPLLKFSADPNFQQEFDERESQLTFRSGAISYRVVAQAAHSSEAAQQYREFSDWYARLGAMLNPGSNPPFPRMAVNAVLGQQQLIPREVHLLVPGMKPYRKNDLVVRSEHRIGWRLSREDREKIDEAGKYLVTLKNVDFDQFRQAQ